MIKKQDKEVVKVLTIMAVSAKEILKNIRKKDTQPLSKAQKILTDLKSEYLGTQAAE